MYIQTYMNIQTDKERDPINFIPILLTLTSNCTEAVNLISRKGTSIAIDI